MHWNTEDIHTIYCFGDSLTAGYGAAPGAGWVEVVAKRHPEINWTNHASLGALTEDILDALEGTAALTSGQEGFFFMGGTNDILCGFRLSALEGRLTERLPSISGKVPLTIGIPPLATKESIWNGWQSEAVYERNQLDLAAYGDFLRELAKASNVCLIDFSMRSLWRMHGTMMVSIRMRRGMSASQIWQRQLGGSKRDRKEKTG